MSHRCHNCGVHEGSLLTEGQTVEVVLQAENKFHRDKKSTVWTCSEECKLQALAISKYGHKTSSWPVTLNQARTLLKREGKI